MSHVENVLTVGVLCGLIFGGVDVGVIIHMSLADERAAMLGAFIARFAIGFVIRAPRPVVAELHL